MKRLNRAFRWFGINDAVSLQEIRQIGVTDIVTALHHLSNGSIWSISEIMKVKELVASHGMTWSVVESLPVSEDIKTRTGNFEQHIENYKVSLANLANSGIKIVTYNFMPILDWTRTNLDYILPLGQSTLYFDMVDLAVFDIFILHREGATQDYQHDVVTRAQERFAQLNEDSNSKLIQNIIAGLPGSEEKYDLDSFKQKLMTYNGIHHQQLREHLILFLREIIPVAEKHDIKMVIHPDDPPFDILGLPRIVSTLEDYKFILDSLPSPSNGICFCTGSLGASPANDVMALAEYLAPHTHFLHFRSTHVLSDGSFYEADHLSGNGRIADILPIFIAENQKRENAIPFRPDHGYKILDDFRRKSNPGYSLIGRMKGMAEVSGLEYGIIQMMEKAN